MNANIIKVYKVGKDFVRLFTDTSSKMKENASNEQITERLKIYKQTFVTAHPDCFSNGSPSLTSQLIALGMFDPFQEV